MNARDSQHSLGSKNNFYTRSYSILQGSLSLSLNQLCFEFNMPIPNHVKVDADGLEEEIIAGGLQVFSNAAIKSILVEISNNCPNIPITMQGLSKKGIAIEDDVWIGAGVRILDRVTVEKGSVIGAGTVLTKSIIPFSIVVGVPSEVIKKRGYDQK